MRIIYPISIQQSSSFATTSSVTLTANNQPISASLVGYSLGNPGPTGPTLTVNGYITTT